MTADEPPEKPEKGRKLKRKLPPGAGAAAAAAKKRVRKRNGKIDKSLLSLEEQREILASQKTKKRDPEAANVLPFSKARKKNEDGTVALKKGPDSSYTPQMAQDICRKLADGKTLRMLADSDPGMPTRDTVNRWMREHPDFKIAAQAARREGAQSLADEALDRARSVKWKDDVPAARLNADVALRLAAAYDPATFGDKKFVQQSVDMNVEHDFTGLDREQRRLLLNMLDAAMIDVTPRPKDE